MWVTDLDEIEDAEQANYCSHTRANQRPRCRDAPVLRLTRLHYRELKGSTKSMHTPVHTNKIPRLTDLKITFPGPLDHSRPPLDPLSRMHLTKCARPSASIDSVQQSSSSNHHSLSLYNQLPITKEPPLYRSTSDEPAIVKKLVSRHDSRIIAAARSGDNRAFGRPSRARKIHTSTGSMCRRGGERDRCYCCCTRSSSRRSVQR